MHPFLQGGRTSRALAHALVLLFCTLPAARAGEDFPTRPIKIAIPSLPGGGLDVVGRAIAARLGEVLEQPVVVENKPDSRFVIAAAYVAKAAPDGYTLLYSNISIPAVNPAIFKSLPYSVSELAPVVQVTTQPVGLYVNADLPVHTVQELLDMLRKNPGKLNNGVGGPSGLMHSELFKSLAQVDYVDINYKGAAASFMSMAAGETQMGFGDIASSGSLLRAGRIRILAFGSPRRSSLFPDVPTLAESGVPGYATESFTGLFAPAGTPRPVVLKINAAVQKVLAMPDIKEWFRKNEVEQQVGSPEDFARVVAGAQKTWSDLARERGIAFD